MNIKLTDWLWVLWGLAIPVLGLMFFGVIGLIIGIVLFVIYVWLILLSKKPKRELQAGVDDAVNKLDESTKKMENMTERIKADTNRRKAASAAKEEAKKKAKRGL